MHQKMTNNKNNIPNDSLANRSNSDFISTRRPFATDVPNRANLELTHVIANPLNAFRI